MDTNEPTSNGKPSFFRRVRHFLAWDGWIVRREIPEGFRLRRYVAWNAVGALCGLGLLAGAVALILSVPPKGCVERVFYELTRVSNAIAGSFDVNVTSASMPMDDGPAPCWFLFGIVFGLVAFWLVLHCGSRVVFALRKNDKTESCGMFDAGRLFAGIVRPVILLWVLYIAATPVRPLGLYPVNPSMIPDWLKDENGNIVRPREFLVAEGECPDWNAFGWSNLVERLGEPLPPEIRLVYEMRDYGILPHDKGLGEKADFQLTERFREARTNLVSLSRFPDEMREEVEEWMAVCGKRLSRYEQCTGPQTWRFVVTNGFRSAIEQVCSPVLPTFRDDFRHTQADLRFSADSGSAEDFLKAARRAYVFRSACLRFEDGLIHHLMALLVSSIETADVIRFCERKDVDSDSFAVARRSIGENRPLFLARGTARACALDGYSPPSLLKPVYEELGVAFWKVPRFGLYPRNSRPGPFMRRVGALTMFAFGCDYRGFLAGEENIASWNATRLAGMVDPDFTGKPFPEKPGELDCPDEVRFLDLWFCSDDDDSFQILPLFRFLWKRGGYERFSWQGRRLPLFQKFVVKALFADAYPAVEDAALQLAEARAMAKRPANTETNSSDDQLADSNSRDGLAVCEPLEEHETDENVPGQQSGSKLAENTNDPRIDDDATNVFVAGQRPEKQLEKRLADNHNYIAVDFQDVTVYDAVLRIADLAKIPVSTSLMQESDRRTTVEDDEAGRQACRVTYFSYDKFEWRMVLASVLVPEYTFDEKDGMVRVMTKSRAEREVREEKERMERKAMNAIRRKMVPVVLGSFAGADTKSPFVDLRHADIEPPEDAVPGCSAYALALVPKPTAPAWFREGDRIAAWVVVRNPSFPGTRPSRIYVLKHFDGSEFPTTGNPFAESDNAKLAVPAALFGPDPEAIDVAERMMEEDGWQLK